MALPDFTDAGDLPLGVHRATLAETLARFGTDTLARRIVAGRLERIHRLAVATGQVGRFVIFGSFITAKPEPLDVDVFLIMTDEFDAGRLTGEAQLLFDHVAAQSHFGASVFWMRRLAAFGGEQVAVEHWQVKRDGGYRGIVEIVSET